MLQELKVKEELQICKRFWAALEVWLQEAEVDIIKVKVDITKTEIINLKEIKE